METLKRFFLYYKDMPEATLGSLITGDGQNTQVDVKEYFASALPGDIQVELKPLHKRQPIFLYFEQAKEGTLIAADGTMTNHIVKEYLANPDPDCFELSVKPLYIFPQPINNISVQPAEVILPQMPKTATITSGPGGSKKLTVA